jgi:glycosyltransferase involved in cell wall biosynthesis
LAPEVTILCATLNGGDVVRLTFSSLRRFTPEPYRILVADNGSTDSTLDYLRSLDWIELFKLDQHRTKASHGATLDWLAKKVETRYLLTLDSDVAFLRHGWLGELSDTLAAQDLAAVGEFEPAVGAYRPRLAPHVLLLNTERFLALGTSFESCVRFDDSAEVRRWRGRSKSEYLSQEELNSYHSAAFYSTGAALFETVLETGERWAPTPLRIARKYRHFGHMSWGAGETAVADTHRAKRTAVRRLLRQYAMSSAQLPPL